jgi:glycosyltransferase involved in cell wall biosynthesis
MNIISFSFIIPVYNRPREIEELLESMVQQSNLNFEVIIVEDGSTIPCFDIVERFKNILDIKYYSKNNSGPGLTRNFGCEKASGNYFIFLDSDCILPPTYFSVVSDKLKNSYVDAFGGPDNFHPSFSALQKAINYSMTSFFTTGGIRGGSEKVDKFYPRSFNMGYSKSVFEKTNGFSKMRFGEDIDLSIRILEAGFSTRLLKDAYVFHKRRTTFKQFFKQVFNSGVARINLNKLHPGALKLVHLMPTAYTLGLFLLIALSLFVSIYFLIPVVLYVLMIFFDSLIRNKNVKIGVMSVLTANIQLIGYGLGMLFAFIKVGLLNDKEYSAFKKNFYQ